MSHLTGIKHASLPCCHGIIKHAYLLIACVLICCLQSCGKKNTPYVNITYDEIILNPSSLDGEKISIRCRLARDGVDGILAVGIDAKRPFKKYIFTEIDDRYSGLLPEMITDHDYTNVIIINGIYKKGGYKIKGNIAQDIPYIIIHEIIE